MPAADTAMRPELAAIRQRLVQLFEAIPDYPPEDKAPELVRQAEALVDGIGWLDAHPQAEPEDYRSWSRARKAGGR